MFSVSPPKHPRNLVFVSIASTRPILDCSLPTICVTSTFSMFIPHLPSCWSLLRRGSPVLRAISTSRTLVTATRPITSLTGECAPYQPHSVASRSLLCTISCTRADTLLSLPFFPQSSSFLVSPSDTFGRSGHGTNGIQIMLTLLTRD